MDDADREVPFNCASYSRSRPLLYRRQVFPGDGNSYRLVPLSAMGEFGAWDGAGSSRSGAARLHAWRGINIWSKDALWRFDLGLQPDPAKRALPAG